MKMPCIICILRPKILLSYTSGPLVRTYSARKIMPRHYL
jgi:hypothetical protein